MDKQKEYSKRIQHNYDEKFFKRLIKITNFLKIPNLFFKKIKVSGIENIIKIKDKQIIYISNHISLADFLVQGYVFGIKKLPPPRFIAGENLNHFPFGGLWKKCGAISIDRNMKNKTYWKTYSKEIENVLKNKESILVYPEGGRSYTGKIKKNLKIGTLMKIIKNSKNNEIYGIPVFIKYDKRIEENSLKKIKKNKILRDLHIKKGKEFNKEGKFFRASKEYFLVGVNDRIYFFRDVFSYITRIINPKKGNVYLSFGKKFNLNEFYKNNNLKRESLKEKIIKEWKNLDSKIFEQLEGY